MVWLGHQVDWSSKIYINFWAHYMCLSENLSCHSEYVKLWTYSKHIISKVRFRTLSYLLKMFRFLFIPPPTAKGQVNLVGSIHICKYVFKNWNQKYEVKFKNWWCIALKVVYRHTWSVWRNDENGSISLCCKDRFSP